VVRADLHAYVPPRPDVPELGGGRESGRLETVLLTAAEPAVTRARNALVCLDRGPTAVPVDPDEPVAEIAWDGGAVVSVRRLGRHEIWLADPNLGQVVPVRTGEPQRLPTQWSVRFGPFEEVHRFTRFARQVTTWIASSPRTCWRPPAGFAPGPTSVQRVAAAPVRRGGCPRRLRSMLAPGGDRVRQLMLHTAGKSAEPSYRGTVP
jgi:hypothetical protein